jgi:hypothetical protein
MRLEPIPLDILQLDGSKAAKDIRHAWPFGRSLGTDGRGLPLAVLVEWE